MLASPPAVLDALLREADAIGFDQSCTDETGALLRMLAASKPGGKLLNIGTGVGVSCAWMLDGMSADANLWSIDIDSRGSEIAEGYLDRRLRCVVEDAAAFLAGAKATSDGFDLIFADAMPGKYEKRALALDMVATGGFYVVDDLIPTDDFPEAASLGRELVDAMQSDKRFQLLRFDWGTGHLIAVRR